MCSEANGRPDGSLSGKPSASYTKHSGQSSRRAGRAPRRPSQSQIYDLLPWLTYPQPLKAVV